MTLDADACYRALAARDARFDGLFFVGVSSTGIYCRTVCTARTPRAGNCAFFPSAAAAERAGYRPCLVCRPEAAPGRARVDAVGRLIEDGALTEMGVAELATELGVSDRHLRRAVQQQYGVTPVELAQTQRLLLAKRLLTDTSLAIGEVALASGFASLRRFNAVFRERYRLSPRDLRRTGKSTAETLTCEVCFRPPYDGDALLSFLAARAISGVERVEGGRYLRTVALGEHRGWISVERAVGRHTLRVDLSASLARALPRVLRRVRRLFDTSAEPEPIAACLGKLAAAHPGLRVPGAFDGFEAAVRAVLGQQVSVGAARTLAGRLAAALGEPIETPHEGLSYVFPNPTRVADATVDDIASLGLVGSRAGAVIALATAVRDGALRLVPGADVEETMEHLKGLPGVGEWTAQYIAMRALSWPDAFPHTDLGIQKALGEKSPRRVLEIAEAWQPWRAYATMHLWMKL